ncbi:MAG: copper chaperone PCu(A)C [Pseudomonadota bacterium]
MKAALALFATLSLLALAACDTHTPASDEHSQIAEHVTATGATVRFNPNALAPSAAYFTLTGGASDAVLIGASSPDLERAELHESRMDGGMMTMEPIARLPIPAGEQVVFRQGGKHVMLFGISEAARTRGNLALTLDFADGPDQSVVLAFPAQAAEAPVPAPTAPPAHIVPAPRPPVIAAPAPPAPAPAEMDHDKMGDHEH